LAPSGTSKLFPASLKHESTNIVREVASSGNVAPDVGDVLDELFTQMTGASEYVQPARRRRARARMLSKNTRARIWSAAFRSAS